MTKYKKFKNFTVQRNYKYDTHDENGNLVSNLSETDWENKILDLFKSIEPSLKCGALIFHDKDIDTDNNKPKSLHVHMVLEFSNARTLNSICKVLNVSSSQNCSVVKILGSSYRYLTHISDSAINKGKHIYSPNEVYTYNCNYVDKCKYNNKDLSKLGDSYSYKTFRIDVINRKIKISKDDDNDYNEIFENYISDIMDDLSSDKINMKQTKEKILNYFSGNNKQFDFLRKYDGYKVWKHNYQMFYSEFLSGLNFRARNMQSGRNLKTFYLYGEGGSGKTQLAKGLAKTFSKDGETYHSAPAPSKNVTYDFAGMYNGEDVSVFDDVKPSAFDKDEFFHDFDPNTPSMVASRNNDVYWLARFAIFTTSKPIETFCDKLIPRNKYSSNSEGQDSYEQDLYQFYRRIHFILHVEKERNDLYPYRCKVTINVMNVNDYVKSLGRYYKYSVVYCDDVSDLETVMKTAKEIKNVLSSDKVDNFVKSYVDNNTD
ncbi:Rep family protein [Apilactobacillus timberlakei]|uniref:Rep family protein n=1 Tax=Apilactobacillus timberlakei TaxID=2008380 RepID=UPI0015E84E52|nr:Rep family protein [Apilactobacillus timberlakei]